MKIDVLNTGHFRLDGGAMFGVVPKTLWSRSLPADDYNRISMGLNVMLIQTDDRRIIVDAGMGDKMDDKAKSIYAYEEPLLLQALEKQGLSAKDITDVIITHMHFDHIGGLTYRDSDGYTALTFPKATHHVNKIQWNWAQKPSSRDRASYLRENYESLIDSENLNIIDGPGELLPHIDVINVDGHTPGQQLVKVNDDETWVFMADLIPTHHHLPIPYVMGYDLEPLKTIEEKVKILQQAEKESWNLVFEHDANMPFAKIKKGEKHYEVL